MRPRPLSALCGIVLAAAGSVPATAAIAGLQLASRADSGVNPSAIANTGGVAGDGSRVAFTSADALAGLPVGGLRQVYVREPVSGRTILVSRTRAGQPADAAVDGSSATTRGPAVSADGRFVAFSSSASNLVVGDDDGGRRDVFRADLVTGSIRLVSDAAQGPSVYDVDEGVDISADGTRVVYGRILPGGARELVVRDLLLGGESVVSVGPDGSALGGPFGQPDISADGRVVAFSSSGQVYVRDLGSGTTRHVGAGLVPSLSGDGSAVVLSAGSVVRHVVVATGVATVVSANGADPGVSADGRRVVWTDMADALPDDTNGLPDVYVGFVGGVATRASERAAAPVQIARAATAPALSADGGRLAFELDDGPAPSTSLVANDSDLARDVLTGTMTPTDAVGPQIVAGVDATSTTGTAVTVSGRVTDPSGVAYVVVRGTRARVDGGGGFAVTLNLVGGANTISVRAMDGAGNVSQVPLVVSRTLLTRAGVNGVPRATGLSVVQSGKRMLVRFRLDRRATRVSVRLARRQTAGGVTRFVPVGAARRLSGVAGARGGLLATKPLDRGIYQVRITVIAPTGTRVVAHRFVITKPPPPAKKRRR